MSSPLARRCAGFTMVELLASLAIISILVALIVPSLGKYRSMSRQTQCASNLRQIHSAILMNANENNGMLMLAYEYGPKNDVNAMWYEPKSQLASYVGGSEMLKKIAICPELYIAGSSPKDKMGNSIRSENGLPFVVNYNVLSNNPGDAVRVRISQISKPSQTVMMADTKMVGSWGQGFSVPEYTSWERIGTPHNNKTSVLWCDGHISLQSTNEIRDKTVL